MKLAIISHTEHYKTPEGAVVGWSPTVNEINHLLHIFDEIYHVAMLKEGDPPPSVMAYTSNKIKFVPLPALGGKTVTSKVKTIYNAPLVMSIVSKTLKKVDCFQLRTPTGIGVFLIPYLTLLTRKKGWFKYAGNWNQSNAPLGYRIQRKLLKMQNRPVTINGRWKDQPSHCITFENPCLTSNNIQEGQQIEALKLKYDKLDFCYVGRLEKEKGVERIIKAFSALSKASKSKVNQIHLVGNGNDLEYFKSIAKDSGINIIFHGFLSQSKVFDIYRKSHVFIMPTTASEGFPKVIAEAMNFKCIPLVSNVSSIGQYVSSDFNGFVLDEVNTDNIVDHINQILSLDKENHSRIIKNMDAIVKKFTFEHYNERIINELLK
ncbi:glycosyltransferase [Psychroserpens luteus]|uniref:Glycosyltransferase n=1 Tax=Psychroserpens luteus TaxID=1434066 RepID=A0ABW5ZUZ3_9FLAO|nr:glycosyltransferase [Psychroserpens luteus]